MKIPMVITSHDKLGNTGRKTGFWLEAGQETAQRPRLQTGRNVPFIGEFQALSPTGGPVASQELA